MDALPAPTLELAHWAARLLGLCPPAAALHRLIGLVLAVRVAITAPQGGDALRVIAAELVLATGGSRSRALLLIAAVPAVIVTITNKDWCHAFPIMTLEIVGGTCLGICSKIGKGISII